MATNNRPKLELKVNQEVKLRLLKDKAYIGESSVGKYFLYSVKNVDTGEELSFFAPENIHEAIVSQSLNAGSEFMLKRSNGKFEFSLIGKSATPEQTRTDNLRDIMLQSVKDAEDVVEKSGIQFSNDELQKFATTMFIARAKQAF
jgi:hypothetical protein